MCPPSPFRDTVAAAHPDALHRGQSLVHKVPSRRFLSVAPTWHRHGHPFPCTFSRQRSLLAKCKASKLTVPMAVSHTTTDTAAPTETALDLCGTQRGPTENMNRRGLGSRAAPSDSGRPCCCDPARTARTTHGNDSDPTHSAQTERHDRARRVDDDGEKSSERAQAGACGARPRQGGAHLSGSFPRNCTG